MEKPEEIIWLQAYDEEDELLSPAEHEVTWCVDMINNNDEPYLRADVALNSISEMRQEICNLCIRLNPQHEGCNWCSQTESWRNLEAELSAIIG